MLQLLLTFALFGMFGLLAMLLFGCGDPDHHQHDC
jgi:hypothetical protein